MIDTSETLRGVFLAALVVLSIFGGTIMFAGSVAAAEDATITATPDTASTTATHHVSVGVSTDEASTSRNNVRLDSTDATGLDDSISEHRGDLVEVTLTLSHNDTATVVFGGDNTDYQANITVEDTDDDGEATFWINTYVAGHGSDDLVGSANDTIVSVNQTGEIDGLLDAGEYNLAVRAGDHDPRAVLENPDLVRTVLLTERSTDSHTVWTAPADQYSQVNENNVSSLEDVTLTQNSTIANGDIVVHKIGTSGIYGALEAEGNLSAVAETGNISLTVKQTDETIGQDRNAMVVDLSASDYKTVPDADNDTLYLVFDTDQLEFENESKSVEDGDAFNTTFSVNANSWLNAGDADEEVNATYEVVDPETEFTEGPITLEAGESVTISGTSTVAPGTEFEVRVRSESQANPFILSNTTTVQSDGTFAAEFNLSDVPTGVNVTVHVDRPLGQGELTANGRIVEVGEATTTTGAEITTTTTEAEGTTTTSASGAPGFGIVTGLVALIGAVLLALCRED